MSRRFPGFSLIETVLALGLVTTAALVIIAMLPAGLDSLRDSQREVVEARIADQLRQQCRSGATGTFYFDSDGTELSHRTVDAAIAARIETAGIQPLPGNSGPALQRYRLSISHAIGTDPFADPRQVSVQYVLEAAVPR